MCVTAKSNHLQQGYKVFASLQHDRYKDLGFKWSYTVKPRLEAHMDMILFEVYLKSID